MGIPVAQTPAAPATAPPLPEPSEPLPEEIPQWLLDKANAIVAQNIFPDQPPVSADHLPSEIRFWTPPSVPPLIAPDWSPSVQMPESLLEGVDPLIRTKFVEFTTPSYIQGVASANVTQQMIDAFKPASVPDEISIDLPFGTKFTHTTNLYDLAYMLADAIGSLKRSPVPEIGPGDPGYIPPTGVPDPPGFEVPVNTREFLEFLFDTRNPPQLKIFVDPFSSSPGVGFKLVR